MMTIYTCSHWKGINFAFDEMNTGIYYFSDTYKACEGLKTISLLGIESLKSIRWTKYMTISSARKFTTKNFVWPMCVCQKSTVKQFGTHKLRHQCDWNK